MSAYKHPDDKGPQFPSSTPDSAGVILKLMGFVFFLAVLAALVQVIIK